MLNIIKVSGVAVGQWKRLCKKHKNTSTKQVVEHIKRAVVLGDNSHVYKNGNIIVRYYDLNLLMSDDEVQTIWRDTSRPRYFVPEEEKENYKTFKKLWEEYSFDEVVETQEDLEQLMLACSISQAIKEIDSQLTEI